MATLYLSALKQKTSTGFDELILKSTSIRTGTAEGGEAILLDAALANMTTAINTATATANAALPVAGGTMTGTLTLAAAPVNDLEAATKKYVDEAKTAVSGEVTTLAGRVTTAEGAIDAIEADYLKTADKTALQTAITNEETARTQADSAQIERIAALESTITGLSGAMHFKGVKEAVPADGTGYENGDVIIVGNKEYVLNGNTWAEFGDASVNAEAITALTTRVSTAEGAIDAIEADYLKAADKTELQGNIDAEAQAREQADTALAGRVSTIEGNIGTGKVDDRIATAKQEAIDAAASAADTKDQAILTEAKDYTDTEIDKVEGTISTLSGRVSTIEGDYLKAADKTELQGNIDAEAQARETAVTNEATARSEADAALQEAIDALEETVAKPQSVVSATEPTDLAVGGIWFEVEQ